MKHHGCICDFTPQRNRELMQAYRRHLSSRSFIDLHEVCSEVANSPCSRFWVSEERATVVMSALLKGQYALDSMSQQKREMFLEIFRRVSAMRQEQPDMTLSDVVFLCVNSPAPRFYMTSGSVLQTIWKIRKGHYKTNQKRYTER